MPLLGDRNLFHTVWLAVVFSAWYCGLGPSIVTTVLSALGIWYWFIPPVHTFNIHDRSQMFGLLAFFAVFQPRLSRSENRTGADLPQDLRLPPSLTLPTMPSFQKISTE